MTQLQGLSDDVIKIKSHLAHLGCLVAHLSEMPDLLPRNAALTVGVGATVRVCSDVLPLDLPVATCDEVSISMDYSDGLYPDPNTTETVAPRPQTFRRSLIKSN